MRAYRKRNPPKKTVRVLTEEQRRRGRAKTSAWAKRNRDRRRAYTRRWREDHPGAAAKATARWREKNAEKATQSSRTSARNRRAAKRGAPGAVSREDVARIFRQQKGRCAYCPRSLKRGFHVDHVQAITRGGKHVARNVQLTCEPCNLKKGARDAVEFARSLGRLL